MALSSTSRTTTYRFLGDECLYRDHNGRRVIADIEGYGRFESHGDIEVFLDGRLSLDKSCFSEHLLAVASTPGDSGIVVTTEEIPIRAGVEVVSNAIGCGWVISAKAPVEIDGSHVLLEPPIDGFAIPFFNSARSEQAMTVSIEKGMATEVIDSFDISDSDALEARGWSVQNGSDFFELSSTFSDGTTLTALHMSHLNTASWTLELPPQNDGLVIRKLYNRFHGRQRARVLIDGAHAGWWYEPQQDRGSRWAWASFGVPSELTRNKSRVRVSIDPPAGVPLWDVSSIEVLAILRQ